MKIILLSGGSGKRLWPLSSDTRSKQFLPLLETPAGEKESMVQRVVRQIREAGLTESITFAADIAQRDIIVNQLGDGVDIVTEPERRDTFPAAALAAAYLAYEKKCPADEVVVVMPCDPYTGAGYFQVIAQMAEAVRNGAADLVLMGTRPTYPSSKYGYIVPAPEKTGETVRKVLRFIEKPSVSCAEELLEYGALWNGGVFAFRLGYILKAAARYVPAETFEAVRSRYAEFPKISLDYEVAEKAGSAAVVPFAGQWKDLGTWMTLTEELSQNGIGNVILGEKNENTHVINELGIPVFCDGLKDVVVAGSPDGILVCAKKSAENIKHYADRLANRPMYEERRWGIYRVLDTTTYGDGNKSLTKFLKLKAGKNISYQVHHHRDEVWTFTDGEGLLVIDGETRPVKRGDVICIKKEQRHALKAVTDLTMIEVQIGDELIEEDIERFDWQWN